MSKSRWSSALAVAPLATLLLTGAAAAQDPGTPETDDGSMPSRFVLPDECVSEPMAAADLAAKLGSEAEFQGVQISVPLGEPADIDTSLLVNDTVREVIACLNGEDYLRLGSLTTDYGAQQLLAGLAAQAGDDIEGRLAQEPVARGEEALIRLIAVTDQTVLADGRLAAFVVLNEPTNLIRGPETYLFVFTREGDALRLDGLFGFSVAPAPTGTPEADEAAS